jgi:cytochrome P450
MAENSGETLQQEAINPSEGIERNESRSSEVQNLAGQFDPFHDPYLADPYHFFAQARPAAPVFYSPDLDYWVVTRYHDIRHSLQSPRLISAANTLAPLARLQARVVVEELSASLPSLRLVPEQPLRFQPNTTFRGPLSLLVEWDT